MRSLEQLHQHQQILYSGSSDLTTCLIAMKKKSRFQMDGVWLRKLRTHPNAAMRKMQNQERLFILHEM